MNEPENYDCEPEQETYTQIDAFIECNDGTLEAVDFYGTDD